MAEQKVAAPEPVLSADQVAEAAADVAALAATPVHADRLQDVFARLFTMADTVAAARQADPQSSARAEMLNVDAALIESLIDRLVQTHLA